MRATPTAQGTALLLTLLASAPATALAGSSGGASADPAPAASAATPQTAPAAATPVAPANGVVPAAAPIRGRAVSLLGRVAGSGQGTPIVVQRLLADGTWVNAAPATLTPDGSFSAAWTPATAGPEYLRAATTAGTVTPPTPTVVFRPARATLFGPGLYGRKMACGAKLTHAVVGVAHKTLPCGTPVAVTYGGRTVVAPVVDRGPFRKGVTYDLTSAAAAQLGMRGSATVGAVRANQPLPAQ